MSIAEHLTGTGRYIKWDEVGRGTIVGGEITDVTVRQARKFQSTDLDFWNDGSPKMQAVITIKTDLRDASDPDDDGTRSISINLWSGQKQALVAACKTAGVTEPAPGMRFTAAWTDGQGVAGNPRVFTFTVTPGAGLGAALGTQATAPAAVAAAAPAAIDPAVAAAIAQLSPAQRQQLGMQA